MLFFYDVFALLYMYIWYSWKLGFSFSIPWWKKALYYSVWIPIHISSYISGFVLYCDKSIWSQPCCPDWLICASDYDFFLFLSVFIFDGTCLCERGDMHVETIKNCTWTHNIEEDFVCTQGAMSDLFRAMLMSVLNTPHISALFWGTRVLVVRWRGRRCCWLLSASLKDSWYARVSNPVLSVAM